MNSEVSEDGDYYDDHQRQEVERRANDSGAEARADVEPTWVVGPGYRMKRPEASKRAQVCAHSLCMPVLTVVTRLSSSPAVLN